MLAVRSTPECDNQDLAEEITRPDVFVPPSCANTPTVWRLAFPALVVPTVFVWTSTDVVICLCGVGCVVAPGPQEIGIVLDLVVRDSVAAAHGLGSVGNSIHAGDPAGPGGGADRGVVEAVEVAESFAGELIDGGSSCIRASVAADPRDPIVLAGDPKDVWAVAVDGEGRVEADKGQKDAGESL